MPCWINGLPAEQLSVRDRGLAYGDGLFETIAVRRGQALLLDRHLQRVIRGCQQLLIPVDAQLLRQEVSAFVAQVADAVVKLIITRGEGQRGYALPQPQQPQRILIKLPLPSYPAEHAEQGISLFPCTTRLAEQPLLAGIKHLNRLEQVLARAEWQESRYAEGLVRDMSGRMIEGVFSNLFLVRDGRLLTPDLSRCGIAGVMRAEIIDRATRLGLTVTVADIGLDELLAADEIFVCNSLYGIWPVRELDGHVWPLGGLTRTLQNNLQDLLGG